MDPMMRLAPCWAGRSLLIAVAALCPPVRAAGSVVEGTVAAVGEAEQPASSTDSQALSCWVDGPAFFGTTVRYVRRDGVQVEDRIGFDAGDRVLHTFHNGMSVCLKARGELAVGTGGRILAFPVGAWLLIAARDSTRNVELRITTGLGGLAHAWSVDGVSASFGAEGEALLALAGEYWPYFGRIASVNAELRRIGQELEALANAREAQQVRMLAQAEAREEALEGALTDLSREGLGQEALITQDTSRITITRRTGAGETTSVYNLNGAESRNVLTLGDETVEQVSRATWQGSRLVITSSVDVGNTALQTTMSLVLDSSGRLVVQSTGPRTTGEMISTTRRYRRGNG
jgi:hypothetical protein